MQTPRGTQELKYVKYFFKENTLLHSVLSFSLASFYLKVKLPFLSCFFLFKLLFKLSWFWVVFSTEVKLFLMGFLLFVTGQAWINILYSFFWIFSSFPTLFPFLVFLINCSCYVIGNFCFSLLEVYLSTQSYRPRSSTLAAYAHTHSPSVCQYFIYTLWPS